MSTSNKLVHFFTKNGINVRVKEEDRLVVEAKFTAVRKLTRKAGAKLANKMPKCFDVNIPKGHLHFSSAKAGAACILRIA